MSSSPQVSVIIPTYNRAGFLVEALRSVLAQSYPSVEVIVADDGSGDDTAARVSAFGNAVRYLPLAHSGRPSVARNRALAVAQGELIAFLDDDDYWQPDKLQRHVALFGRDPAHGFVYSDFSLFHGDSVAAPALAPWQKKSGYIFDDLLRDCFIHPSTVVVQRRLLQATGSFDETLSIVEDYDLWLRLAHAAPAGFVDAPLTMVRRHPGGISFQRQEQIAHNMIRTLEQAGRRLRLTRKQRLQLRQITARRHTHLGLLLSAADQPRAARSQLWHALRLNPLQRAAWLGLLGTSSRR